MSENLYNVYIRTHINGYKEKMKDCVLGIVEIGSNLAVEPGPNTQSSNQLWDLVFYKDSKDSNTFCIFSKEYGKVMERAEQKLVLNYQDDSKKKLQEWMMDGNYLMMHDPMMQDLVMHIDKEKALLTLSERIVGTEPLPSYQQFSIISCILYIKNVINQEIVLDTEGREPGSRVVPNVRNPSSYSQLWYLEYHLDGTFHIVSNIDRKVMERSESRLVITDRSVGKDNLSFRWDGDSFITMQDLVVVYDNYTNCVFLETKTKTKTKSTSSTQPNQQFSFVRAV